MSSWADFKDAAPELAAAGERLFRRGETDEALLATVFGDEPPRINPIWVRVIDGALYAFILRSPKRTALERDGRFALHTHQDPALPSEFSVRGRARLIEAGAVHDRVAAEWYFEIDDTYHLFEFGIETALLGVRDGPDEWPPRYTSWTSPAPRRAPAAR